MNTQTSLSVRSLPSNLNGRDFVVGDLHGCFDLLDRLLEERGVPVIPDILANAGGVIASYIEWRQAKSGSLTEKTETYEVIDKQISKAYASVADFARSESISRRLAAQCLAVDEVASSMQDRGWI